MPNPKYKTIQLKNLLLAVDNPRFLTEQQTQNDAIRELISEQGDKLINLGESIVANGLNPSDLVIVTPFGETTKYVVHEGNRRVAALRLLNDPSLCSADAGNRFRVAFTEMKREMGASGQIKSLYCLVCKNREEAEYWIKLKHTGENKGAGPVKWDSDAQDRYNERFGSKTLAGQVKDFLKKNSEIEEEKINKVPVSSLQRLVGDKKIQQILGIQNQKGKLKVVIEAAEFTKPFEKIVEDLSSGNVRVNKLYYKGDREAYIKGFEKKLLPDLAKKAPSKSETIKPNVREKIRPSTAARKPLIPSNYRLTITHPRVNDIYKELRALEVEAFPNAVAVTFRVFIEVSADHFIDVLKPTGVTKDSKLVVKLKAIADHMERNSILDKHALKALRVNLEKINGLLSTNTLNAYVHNKTIRPRHDDLKLTWDEAQAFITAIWHEIEKNE